MMESWPKLRRIEVNEFLSDKAPETPITLGTSQVSACCPDLRESTLSALLYMLVRSKVCAICATAG